MTCPACKTDRGVNTGYRVEDYEHQVSDIPRVTASTRIVIPVRQCAFCGFEWTDEAAEQIRTRAIRKLLGGKDEDVRF